MSTIIGTRRWTVLAALFLASFFGSALVAQEVESIEVSGFEGHQQEASNWCWAASIQSLFASKGLDVDQSAIVAAAYGQVVNATAPGFEGTLRLLHTVVVDIDGTEWEVHARAGASYPDARWLLQRFRNDEPVMIWFHDEYANHSIVIHGGTYYVNAAGSFMGWQSIVAYDPLLDTDMTIDARNIPRYVYGTFEVSIRER
ncbi:MAG: hypothetical protein JO197_01610 [Acidobacteria bacterium]|nr:hypothetical protein [Acidobacteriota bacterium]MBV9478859.1 hypothetical protein [Acidobacteriota bacterium]